eukprot:CAMPEP_0180611588 /NCGR_PEP_ID=MMETSP1037_2-20121125/29897_1 /TAXON_ID=632150 /ORGANISM="Azadinium spinosum, Strain 3D9" /LENGTH=49 /DNA_ID=CAMNT_0022631111 /DNA_START=681 /DNA_END=830 /DNA_ORIENTATION=+
MKPRDSVAIGGNTEARIQCGGSAEGPTTPACALVMDFSNRLCTSGPMGA